jgi:hypothetical protein
MTGNIERYRDNLRDELNGAADIVCHRIFFAFALPGRIPWARHQL